MGRESLRLFKELAVQMLVAETITQVSMHADQIQRGETSAALSVVTSIVKQINTEAYPHLIKAWDIIAGLLTVLYESPSESVYETTREWVEKKITRLNAFVDQVVEVGESSGTQSLTNELTRPIRQSISTATQYWELK